MDHSVHNNLTAEGIRYLGKAAFPKLKTLSLGKNSISNDGCLNLVDIPLPELKLLHLSTN